MFHSYRDTFLVVVECVADVVVIVVIRTRTETFPILDGGETQRERVEGHYKVPD